MKWASIVLSALGIAAQHRVDLTQPPWLGPMATWRRQGDLAARAEIEDVARRAQLAPWERAYAWRMAGTIAFRHERYDAARDDFTHARAADPGGFDGQMAQFNLGEVAMRQRRWYEAQRLLESVADSPDTTVSTYARDRLRAVRERVRRLTLRWGSVGVLALAGLALVVRVIRRRSRVGTLRSFGRALLVTEFLAVATAAIEPRVASPLAQSGTMAFAVPFAVAIALVWATREPGAPWWKRSLVVAALLVAMAAGLYTALEITWLSVERPMLG